MRTLFTVLIFSIISPLASAADSAPVFEDRANGFRISPPDFEPNEAFGFTSQPVTFSGPLKGGVAPACNVQVQNPGLTPARYKDLTYNQLESLRLTIEREEDRKVSGKDATFWRFSGNDTTAVALSVYAGDKVFLVSCMTSSEAFKQLEKTFLSTIESFSLVGK